MNGILALVATPIGNLSDFSPRGLETLEKSDLIACEDTRRTGSLLQHFGILTWCMEGLLPRKGESRSRRIKEIAEETRTTVLFESPHRLAATLKDLYEECGGARQIAIVRELTKKHEEIFRGSLAESLV